MPRKAKLARNETKENKLARQKAKNNQNNNNRLMKNHPLNSSLYFGSAIFFSVRVCFSNIVFFISVPVGCAILLPAMAHVYSPLPWEMRGHRNEQNARSS